MCGCPTAAIEEWRAECFKVGLLDKDKRNSASALFSKCKRDLIAANWIGLQRGLDAAELAGCLVRLRTSETTKNWGVAEGSQLKSHSRGMLPYLFQGGCR